MNKLCYKTTNLKMDYFDYSNEKVTIASARSDYAKNIKMFEESSDDIQPFVLLGCLNLLNFNQNIEKIKDDISFLKFKDYVYNKKIQLGNEYKVKHSDNDCKMCWKHICIVPIIESQFYNVYKYYIRPSKVKPVLNKHNCYPCDICGRICRARIGLRSHEKKCEREYNRLYCSENLLN